MATTYRRRAVVVISSPGEKEAVLSHLDGHRPDGQENTDHTRGTFAAGGMPWDVLVVASGGDTDSTAAMLTRAITDFEPQVALLVGTATGLSGVSAGDVVAATQVYSYDEGTSLHAYPEQTPFLMKELAHEARGQRWQSQIGAPALPRTAKVALGPVAVGWKDLASTQAEAASKIRASHDQMSAMALEGSAFLKAVRQYPWLNAMIVLGISHVLDKAKDSHDSLSAQDMAARHAAAFAFTLLGLYQPPPIIDTRTARTGKPGDLPALPDDLWPLLARYVPDSPPQVGKLPSAALQGALAASLMIHANRMSEPRSDEHRAIYQRVRLWLAAALRSDELAARERLSVGLTLGFMGDPRPSTGLTADKLPDIAWTDLYPAGLVGVGHGAPARIPLRPFRLSRFPVTHQQYQAFIDARSGYRSARWWDFSDDAQRWHERNPWPAAARWEDRNCPRVNVSWFEAVAYCRWLSAKGDYGEVRLPTEAEMEYATYKCPPQRFPWGDAFTGAETNSREGRLERISPVGIWPKGRSRQGAEALLGNVWEYCQTAWGSVPYADEGRERLSGRPVRVIRGGSWNTLLEESGLTVRQGCDPATSSEEWGFRLCQPLA